MKAKSFWLFVLLCVAAALYAEGQDRTLSSKISKYVDFIENRHTSPVDYVMSLFDRYDVVILGERDHRDTTQYDLIEQIMADPRFIDKVGHVMTEVGVYNMTDEINQVVSSTYKSDQAFEAALWGAYKNIDYTPLWENTNFHHYLSSVYRINRQLPTSKKIRLTLTDVPFSWRQTADMTPAQFQGFLEVWREKDLIMADHVLTELYKLFDGSDPRKKALIIFNAPHSFIAEDKQLTKKGNDSAGQIIQNRFPGRVANVMLNWAQRKNGYRGLVQDGRWDAAFAACGNKSIGFDFASSPFGDDLFDLRPGYFRGHPKYQEIYTGFIFFRPVEEWVAGIGIPNSADSDFVDELVRRDCEIWDGNSLDAPAERAELWDYYTTVKAIRFPNLEPAFIKTAQDQVNRYYKSEIGNKAAGGRDKK